MLLLLLLHLQIGGRREQQIGLLFGLHRTGLLLLLQVMLIWI